MKKILFFLIPLGAFLSITLFLLKGLFSEARYEVSISVDKQVPEFALPDVMDPQQIYTKEVFLGQKTLLNVWGVWCVTCAVELPYLAELRKQGIRIVGLYYQLNNDPDFGAKPLPQLQWEIREMLGKYGDPYQFNIFDAQRSYGMDLGVTGAPETFLIDEQGVVRVHHVGDLNPRVWQEKFAAYYSEDKASAQGAGR
ncbi:DsbE family thiol:disulfide interchange protein [Paraneptunicella aestuarii]|uniref:DsbE family thiol:disulfide interchange protein n=1 Tax=Paraneptunicella aestuarii TaxID=2831148 RepID=UPI001E3993E9|nr:DsbE family thiol:disulfide interchange protein [Paraneptunicella aestuarii]UAA38131.1 DsbE family thiol:disulfide interchange protein [Paraneptunicella aestuarii]